MREKILKAIEELRKKSKKRKFIQTFDLIVSLKEFDIKKPENRFIEDVVLPRGRGEDAKVVVFSDSLKNLDCKILTNADIENFLKNKKGARKFVKNVDFILAEPKMMVAVGKALGQFIGPRGKIPKIITGDVKSMVENYKKSIRIWVRNAPVVQCLVGREDMKDGDVAENVEAVLKALEAKLPKGLNNIKSVFIKLTMSKPVKMV